MAWDWLEQLKLLGMLPGMPSLGPPGSPPAATGQQFPPPGTPMPGVPGPGAGKNPYMPNLPPPDMMAPHFNPPGAMGMTGPNQFPSNEPPPSDPGFPGVLPPGWKPDQIGPTARASMPPIPGIGPLGRNVDPSVTGEDGLRVNITPGPRNAGSPPPQTGVAPETYDTNALIGGVYPGPDGKPLSGPSDSAAAVRPDWWERNKELVGPEGTLWDAMSGFGAGMLSAPPGSSFLEGLGRGTLGMNQYVRAAPERRARLSAMQDQADERKAKTERRKAWTSFVKEQPADSPIRKWGAFLEPSKLAEKAFDRPAPGFELGEDGKYRLNLEWAEQRLREREASGRDTALQRNAEFYARTYGIPMSEALRMARPQGIGANSTDRAAMDDYIAKNPGKGPMDYMREKASMRAGQTKPTAMMQNTQYLAKVLGIPEAAAARITSQSKEQSDQSFYATIYRTALNSPMVAGDTARADEIARQAVQARKSFQGQNPGSGARTPGAPGAPGGRKTATGPGGVKIYTEDGQNWFHMDGRPYR